MPQRSFTPIAAPPRPPVARSFEPLGALPEPRRRTFTPLQQPEPEPEIRRIDEEPSTFRSFVRGVGAPITQAAREVRDVGGLAFDVGRQLLDPETRGAAIRGFGSSLAEDIADPGQVVRRIVPSREELAQLGEEVRERPLAENVGRAVGNIALLFGTGAAGRAARIGGRAAGQVVRRGLRRRPPGAPTIDVTPTPVPRRPIAPLSTEEALIRREARRRGAPPSRRPTPTPEAPAPSAPAAPRTPVEPGAGQAAARELGLPEGARVTRVAPEAVRDLRRLEGAEVAARRLGRGGQAGTEEVRRIAGGPSRTPLAREVRDLDDRFRLLSETGAARPDVLAPLGGAAAGALVGGTPEERLGGAITGAGLGFGAARLARPGAARSLFDDALALRNELLLSGTAIPKNIATAVGTPVQLAIESRSFRPLIEAARLPTNIREFGQAFREPIDIGLATPTRRRGPVSRAISGVDAQAVAAARRAGIPEDRIQELFLREPTREIVGNRAADILTNPVTAVPVPFSRTALNQLFGGLEESVEGVTGRTLRGRTFAGGERVARGGRVPGAARLVTALTPAAGAATGALTDDPLLLGLASAAAGRRAIPFGAGAALGARLAGGSPSAALRGLTPFPEFGFDPSNFIPTEPRDIGLIRLLEELSGTPRRR